MIRIPGCYRPSSYFPSSRLVKYRTGLFVGGTALLLLLLVPGSLRVFARSGTGTSPALVSIAVTPANASILPDRDIQFTATATYSDGSTHDLTSRVTWSSSVLAVATINRVGGATARAVGQTTIEAALGAINGSATLNVVLGGTFDLTGSINENPYMQSATLLSNDMVLVAGGDGSMIEVLDSAQLYNPATGTFTYTGSLNTARYAHTATLLNNGWVLIAGGVNAATSYIPPRGPGNIASTELYNPATGIFTPTGSLNTARSGHTATLLHNGMVLIAGGIGSNGNSLANAELYDPVTGFFTATGSLNTPRWGPTATLLDNGTVLIAGGYNSAGGYAADAELYNPATGTFSYTTGSLNTARAWHTATLLNDGTVLIAGGYDSYWLDSAELYNPATETFTPTGNMTTVRWLQTATLLNNGMVVIAGGWAPVFTASTEVYDPSTATFTPAGNMNTARADDTATLLNNGMVLMAGGDWGGGSSAELYEPVLCPPADLESIAITPATSTLSPGETQRFIAMGKFSDGTTQQLASVIWSSSNPAVAQISNDASNPGVGLAVAAGTVMIEASAVWVRGSAWLTVK